ncbi:hypothetical protein TNCV_2943351 [Trichonephila clavipes]|nr:hypothetical protein TNCV_2943351 [Trichonephila clavipes]
MLRRRIAARPRPPATVRDLEIALLEEWNSIPQRLINNLIATMANRLQKENNPQTLSNDTHKHISFAGNSRDMFQNTAETVSSLSCPKGHPSG